MENNNEIYDLDEAFQYIGRLELEIRRLKSHIKVNEQEISELFSELVELKAERKIPKFIELYGTSN